MSCKSSHVESRRDPQGTQFPFGGLFFYHLAIVGANFGDLLPIRIARRENMKESLAMKFIAQTSVLKIDKYFKSQQERSVVHKAERFSFCAFAKRNKRIASIIGVGIAIVIAQVERALMRSIKWNDFWIPKVFGSTLTLLKLNHTKSLP